MDTIRPFFPKLGHFFRFSKKGRGDAPYILHVVLKLSYSAKGISRSSQRGSKEKVVLKNFAIFTGKHQAPRSTTLLKRDSTTGVFL